MGGAACIAASTLFINSPAVIPSGPLPRFSRWMSAKEPWPLPAQPGYADMDSTAGDGKVVHLELLLGLGAGCPGCWGLAGSACPPPVDSCTLARMVFRLLR